MPKIYQNPRCYQIGPPPVSHVLILPDDTRILRLIETRYDGADYDYITVVHEIGFFSRDFIDSQIDSFGDDGLGDD